MFEFLDGYEWLAGWGVAISIVTFVGSLIAVPLLVARMRPDYFVGRRPPAEGFGGRHPVARIFGLLVKNALGLVLLLMGIAMLVLPGQGIITMVIGLTMLNFPGKRRLERFIVCRPAVLRGINWMRDRAGRPPLIDPKAP